MNPLSLKPYRPMQPGERVSEFLDRLARDRARNRRALRRQERLLAAVLWSAALLPLVLLALGLLTQ